MCVCVGGWVGGGGKGPFMFTPTLRPSSHICCFKAHKLDVRQSPGNDPYYCGGDEPLDWGCINAAVAAVLWSTVVATLQVTHV